MDRVGDHEVQRGRHVVQTGDLVVNLEVLRGQLELEENLAGPDVVGRRPGCGRAARSFRAAGREAEIPSDSQALAGIKSGCLKIQILEIMANIFIFFWNFLQKMG